MQALQAFSLASAVKQNNRLRFQGNSPSKDEICGPSSKTSVPQIPSATSEKNLTASTHAMDMTKDHGHHNWAEHVGCIILGVGVIAYASKKFVLPRLTRTKQLPQ